MRGQRDGQGVTFRPSKKRLLFCDTQSLRQGAFSPEHRPFLGLFIKYAKIPHRSLHGYEIGGGNVIEIR
jgi:hypothetical protein